MMRETVFPVHKLMKADIGHWKREVGKIIFGENSVLWELRKEKREILYSQISMIFIGDCPQKYRFRDYWGRAGKIDWTKCYGKYIVALNLKMDDAKFACSYNDEIWKVLKVRCKPYEVCFSEEDEIKKAVDYRERTIAFIQEEKNICLKKSTEGNW
jgi:hypothetical protein